MTQPWPRRPFAVGERLVCPAGSCEVVALSSDFCTVVRQDRDRELVVTSNSQLRRASDPESARYGWPPQYGD